MLFHAHVHACVCFLSLRCFLPKDLMWLVTCYQHSLAWTFLTNCWKYRAFLKQNNNKYSQSLSWQIKFSPLSSPQCEPQCELLLKYISLYWWLLAFTGLKKDLKSVCIHVVQFRWYLLDLLETAKPRGRGEISKYLNKERIWKNLLPHSICFWTSLFVLSVLLAMVEMSS